MGGEEGKETVVGMPNKIKKKMEDRKLTFACFHLLLFTRSYNVD